MLFPEEKIPFDDSHWRRINMRKVSHLVGAETIHNLYNRHWPRINSIRFRHTVTNFKGGIVESFAPAKEWTYLQQWLSKKFLALDPILLREIEAIMSPTYDLVDEIMQKVDDANLAELDDQELALLLIDIVDFPLGDIYKLNVVQIEYGLNFALHKLLEKYEPNALDRNELLARLIAPGEFTAAQEEEIAFGKVLLAGQQKNVADPSADEEIMELVRKHHAVFSPSHCAYGEEPPVVQDYVNKYSFMYQQNKAPLSEADAHANVEQLHERSKKLLAKLNDEPLTVLCELMAKIGVFRDRNKAKLGETVIRRLRILDEIARRTATERDELNYYLMAELTSLLDTGTKLPDEIIHERQEKGVCFTRFEDMNMGIQKIVSSSSDDKADDTILGICASPGEVTGRAKIILSKEDIAKVEPGDLMVAIGTDFDLLEIMNLSGGIITEEGGLLSHASVVSRELKKPCLIGVGGATRILQDGDELKLNATEGKIHILKKAN